MQARLGGEFWASDVIMHKAHFPGVFLLYKLRKDLEALSYSNKIVQTGYRSYRDY